MGCGGGLLSEALARYGYQLGYGDGKMGTQEVFCADWPIRSVFFLPSSSSLSSLGASVTGIDPAVGNIDVARSHAAVDPRTRGIKYEHAAVEDFLGREGEWIGRGKTLFCSSSSVRD